MAVIRGKTYALAIISVFALSCGSAIEPSSKVEPEVAKCLTDPNEFAELVYDTALEEGLDGTTQLAMGKEQFAVFLERQGAMAQLDHLWAAHRSDLEYGVKAVQECRGGSVAIEKVEKEEVAFVFYEVLLSCVCANGDKKRFKIKQAKYEGCLYLGAID